MEKNRRLRREKCKFCAKCAHVEKTWRNLCDVHNTHMTVKGCRGNENIRYRVKNIYHAHFGCLSIGKHAEIFYKNRLFLKICSLLT